MKSNDSKVISPWYHLGFQKILIHRSQEFQKMTKGEVDVNCS